jgi:HEAT repeat protein
MLRQAGHKDLTDTLITILNNPQESERFRRFCVQHLGIEIQKNNNPPKEAVISVLRESLTDKYIGVRREALLALVNAGDHVGKGEAVEWLVAGEKINFMENIQNDNQQAVSY